MYVIPMCLRMEQVLLFICQTNNPSTKPVANFRCVRVYPLRGHEVRTEEVRRYKVQVSRR